MSSKYKKDGLICGHISSYCLACEVQLESTTEIKDHLELATHKKNLADHPYLEKYGDDNIRKMKAGYFCEFCNILLSTASKVTMHVQNPSHKDNKGSQMLKRFNGDVIAFNRILIKELSWHSIADETCAVCNIEFDDSNEHMKESTHLLKLVQTKIQFGANNELYRKLDENTFQCITCNQVYALKSMDEHFDGNEHKSQYQQCEDDMKKINATKEKVDAKEVDKENKPNNDPQDEAKGVKTNTDLDKVNKKKEAKNKQKQSTKASAIDEKEDKTKDGKNKHDKIDVDNATKVKKEKNTDVRFSFAKENNITFNIENSNCYCRLCEKKLPATLQCMEEHVRGKEHTQKTKANAEKAKQKITKPINSIRKRASTDFINSILFITDSSNTQYVILNNNIMIKVQAFMTYTTNVFMLRCHICELSFFEGREAISHSESERHQNKMMEIPIITSLQNEFIREIRPCVFHCGFCNLVIPSWNDVENHIECSDHQHKKNTSNTILNALKPRLRTERDMEYMLSRALMERRFWF